MRTNEERARSVRRRTAEIRRNRKKLKRLASEVGSIAVCLIFIIAVGAALPGLATEIAAGEIQHSAGTASLVVKNDALGFILMGLMAFLLGVCVTVLLYRMRRRRDRKHRENRDDEL